MGTFDIFSHIDLIAVFLVIVGGVFSTKYFKWWNINNATKTLIFGTVFISIYLIILHISGELNKADYSKYFISYAVATSFYEIFQKIIVKNIKGKTNS